MSACRSCGAQIEWRKTVAGKSMPVDMTDVAIFVGPSSGSERATIVDSEGRVLTGPRTKVGLPDSTTGREAHFASCPNADAHRRKAPPAPAGRAT